MHYLAAPPNRTHSSFPVSASTAQAFLSRYLDAARTHAALHPDAQLTDRGPAPAQGGGRLGLTLHNLGRIEAGLRGERIQAEPEIEGGQQQRQQLESGLALDGAADVDEREQSAEQETEWMDKAAFEREQDEDDVLLREAPNEREDEDQEGQAPPESNGHGSMRAREWKKRKMPPAVTVADGGGGVDKDARKKAKKERRKMEKAEKEATRKATDD